MITIIKLGIRIILVAILLTVGFMMGAAYTNVTATTVNYQVAHSYDDASENGEGTLNYTDTTCWTSSYTSTTNANYQCSGYLFDNVNVPQGATIDVAYMEIYVVSATWDDMNINIYGNDVDNAVDFYSDQNIISRTLTTANTDWDSDTLGTGWVQTPSIVSAVQEIVDRASWAALNEMAILFIADVEAYKATRPRSYDGSPTLAPKLHIEYTAGSPPDPPDPFTITDNGGHSITLDWTDDTGVIDTKVFMHRWHYPDDRINYEEIYSGTDETADVEGLALDSQAYYFSAWSENATGWSTTYTTAEIGGGFMGVIGIPAIIFIVGLIGLTIFKPRHIILWLALLTTMIGIMLNTDVDIWMVYTAGVFGAFCLVRIIQLIGDRN